MGAGASKKKESQSTPEIRSRHVPGEPHPDSPKQDWLAYYEYHLNDLIECEKDMEERMNDKVAELATVEARNRKRISKIDDHIQELMWMQKQSEILDEEYTMKIADAQEERKGIQKDLIKAEKELEQLKKTVLLYDSRQTLYNEKLHSLHILEKTLKIVKCENEALIESAEKVQEQKAEEEEITNQIKDKLAECEGVRLDLKVQRCSLDTEIKELKSEIEAQKIALIKAEKKKHDVNITCEELRAKILVQVKELGEVQLTINRLETALAKLKDDLEEVNEECRALTEENQDLTEKWKTCEEERKELEIKQNQIAVEYEQDIKVLRKELRQKGNLIAANLKTLVSQMEVLTNEMGKSGGEADYTIHEVRKNMRRHRKQMAEISQQLQFKDGEPLTDQIKEIIDAQEVKNDALHKEKQEVDTTIIDLCKTIRIHVLRLQKIETALTAPIKEQKEQKEPEPQDVQE